MPQVKHYATVSGYSLSGSGASAGLIIISLRDWSERDGKEDDVNSIIGRINTLSQKIPDAQLFAAAPPMINGYGMVNGFELHVQDKTGKPVSELDDATKGFIASLNARKSGLPIPLFQQTIRNIRWTLMPPVANVRGFLRQRCFPRCPVTMAGSMSPILTVSPSSTVS